MSIPESEAGPPMAPNVVRNLPIPPLPSYHVHDPSPPLTGVQTAAYGTLLAHFVRQNYNLPPTKIEPFVDELKEGERFWLSRECMLRFLRASGWKAPAAIERLEDTIRWRRRWGVIRGGYLTPDRQVDYAGRTFTFGFDAQGRPVNYIYPTRRQANRLTPNELQTYFWMLERCIDIMEPGVE
ncbi:hypothetical protein FA15DRAFT_171250 [Coprinopsis marcescibilis]|uniref:CRAL/TRIO N-terminal domain-containing protein n=1 Tax=Coprinopsis marcescibilis TaxID=230819 RepID=A0A5C3L475_COPMA|nr:hypothetical protein FA15DRAFT_171250 [Coprinopsis marcescibilis]